MTLPGAERNTSDVLGGEAAVASSTTLFCPRQQKYSPTAAITATPPPAAPITMGSIEEKEEEGEEEIVEDVTEAVGEGVILEAVEVTLTEE